MEILTMSHAPTVTGQAWERGHSRLPNWLGGKELRPEHYICNRADAPVQQRLRHKNDRIIKKNGLKPDYTKRNQPRKKGPRRKMDGTVVWE
jgi:hypothetical protein